MELVFIMGANIRRVFINKREISLMTPELGNTPLIINLDKLDEKETQDKIKEANLNTTDLEELANLHTEEEIAKDIIRDFQGSGWRLFKRT